MYEFTTHKKQSYENKQTNKRICRFISAKMYDIVISTFVY